MSSYNISAIAAHRVIIRNNKLAMTGWVALALIIAGLSIVAAMGAAGKGPTASWCVATNASLAPLGLLAALGCIFMSLKTYRRNELHHAEVLSLQNNEMRLQQDPPPPQVPPSSPPPQAPPTQETQAPPVQSVTSVAPIPPTNNARAELALPYRNHNTLFSRLGIEWINPPGEEEDYPRYARARLPLGWKIFNKPAQEDFSDFVILDEKNTPRVTVYTKATSYDHFEHVSEVTQEQAARITSEIESIKKQATAEPTLEEQFNYLLIIFNATARSSMNGCPIESVKRGVNNSWDKLHTFAQAHPEFSNRVPREKYYHTWNEIVYFS